MTPKELNESWDRQLPSVKMTREQHYLHLTITNDEVTIKDTFYCGDPDLTLRLETGHSIKKPLMRDLIDRDIEECLCCFCEKFQFIEEAINHDVLEAIDEVLSAEIESVWEPFRYDKRVLAGFLENTKYQMYGL